MSTTIGAPTGAPSPEQDPHRQKNPGTGPSLFDSVRKVLKPLASLQLTVALFALSIVLVFYGTIAQIDRGIWTVVDQYFRSWFVWIPFQLTAEFAKRFFDLHESTVWQGSFPFPGGWLLGGLMLINLFAAHLVRFKLSWKRSGIIILHLGVILLMGGELVTGLYAIESRMVLQVGESRNYIDHSRRVELAVTEEGTGKTAVIPQDMLSRGRTISSPDLPFDIEVVDRYKNTAPRAIVGGDDKNAIVSIMGGRYKVVPAPEVSGVKTEQSEDIPGVQLRLLKKDSHEQLEDRMYSLWSYKDGPAARRFMALPSLVEVDGKRYSVELRNERIIKPYSLELLKFEHAKYAGTKMAKDFASTVRLIDPETGDDREVRIWMNHPLRHRGETFYQSGTVATGSTPTEIDRGDQKDTGTVLQVVKNPGWLLPYISCCVVTLGMFIHFGIAIVRFTGKQRGPRLPAQGIVVPVQEGNRIGTLAIDRPSLLQRLFPWVMIALFGLYAVSKMAPRTEKYKDFDITAFGSIPVLDSGRIKPLDTFARTTMLYISGRSDWQDQDRKMRPASLWMLEVLAAGNPAAKPISDYKVFRIDNEQVLNQLGLEHRPGSYRYSWNEIRNEKFERAFMNAQLREERKAAGEAVPPDEHGDLFHGKLMELGRRLHVYEQLAFRRIPTLIPREPGSIEWRTLASIDEEAGQPFEEQARQEVVRELMEGLAEKGVNPEAMSKEFKNALLREVQKRTQARMRELGERERAKVSPAAAAFGAILQAYRDNKPAEFAAAINKYTSEYVRPLNPEFRDTTHFETSFNAAAPFINAGVLYMIAVVFMALSWLGWREPLRTTALGITVIALLLHGAGLLGRMYLMGRPLVFVTNLYSSGLMIGFAAVAGCLLMEQLFRNGVALVVGASLGAITVKIAHHLATDGNDTLGTLVAVLDTNFWLASHVTTVVLGYSATFIAGFLGMAFLFQMLARVVVQSFQKAEKIDVGEMAAYLAAVGGIVLIPNLCVSLLLTMLSVEEFVPPDVADMLMYFTIGAGVVAALALIAVRLLLLGTEGAARNAPAAVNSGLQNSALDAESMTKLGQMIYGVTCFATLLSFVGTVLGGIWADQSWGRFWGWDPKENGAVLIVIWNALILHARWCGLVKQRGMALLALIGIMITTWSWFGTNQLGVGLHNYGFNKTLAEGCKYTWIICALLVGVGLIPFKYWNSYAVKPTTVTPRV
jgi:ABC-type transport system involved in cytochrome c biogenesis permease subunit